MEVTQSCPTLYDAMDYIAHGILQARMGSLSLLQGIFPAQGLKPGLPHCRWILYQLSHKKVKVLVAQSCLTMTPWIAAHQAPLSVGFSR